MSPATNFRACLLLGCSLVCGPAAAQNADGLLLDLPQAVARTLMDNPALRISGYQVRAQEGRIIQAGVKPAPELMVMVENIMGSGENDLLTGAQTTLSIAWILDHGLTERRVDTEAAARDLMTVDVEVTRLDAAAETARLHLDALSLQTQKLNADAAIIQAEETVEAISGRVEAGAALPAELARARAELARRGLVREDIEHETQAVYHRLAEQWGLVRPDFDGVAGDVFTLPALGNFDLLRARIEQNPDISRYSAQQRLYEAQLRLAEAGRKAPWRVSTGVRRIETTADHAFVLDLNVPLVRADSNRGRLEEARANLARTEAEAQAERLHVETSLYVIYLELQHFIEVATALRDNIIPLYEQALADTRLAYEQGRYGYQELSAVQLELLAARDELVAASVEARRRLIEIERFTGLSIEATQP